MSARAVLTVTRRTACALAFSFSATAIASAQHAERISLSTSAAEPNGKSEGATISDDGRYVAFASYASNLAAVDSNNTSDIFVRDRATGTTILVSEKFGTPGTAANGAPGGSFTPRISGNGRYVLFISGSSDIMSPPPNVSSPLWRKDLVSGVLEPASVRSNGTITTGPPFGWFEVSANGRFLVFESSDPAVVPGDTNGSPDIFIRDFQTATTVRASLYGDGSQISGSCSAPSISDDGRWVLFMGAAPLVAQGNTSPHLLLKDMLTGALTLVDVSAGGAVGNSTPLQPRMSADGRFAVWLNAANNLYVDPFYDNPIVLKNLTSGAFESIAVDNAGVPANNTCSWPQISDDGRCVTFFTAASNLGATLSIWQVALRDRVTHTTSFVSRNTAGATANNYSQLMSISSDGRYVAYESLGTNLDSVDTNADWDIYLRDRFSNGTFEYCVAQLNSLGCTPHMSSIGVPSASAGSGFTLKCVNVINKKPGILIYGVNGGQAVPLTGGLLCVRPPVKRMPGQNSGGSTSGSDCSGQFSTDFNVRIASGLDLTLVLGQDVCAQYWSRDLGAPSGSNLSDAVRFTIQP